MQLQHVDNYTPFEWFAFEKMAPGMHIHDVLIVKAACQILLDGNAYRIAAVPEGEIAPIHMSDQAHDFDRNAYASLRVAGDTVLYKPATDLLLSGAAEFSGRRGQASWAAEVSVRSHGKLRTQTLILHGERHWQWSLLKGWHLSEPTVCERIDLRYELAYGGSYAQQDRWVRHDPNPVGRGFLPLDRMDKHVYYPAARIELAANRLSAPDKPIEVPALGPIPRTWTARKRYAGTYDNAWRDGLKQNGRADYAPDFDGRFFQTAHPQGVFEPHWRGDEHISLVGLTGDKPIDAQLPGWQPVLNGQGPRGALQPQAMRLDTVEIDLTRMRLYLTWRLHVDQDLQIEQARVHLQNLT